MVEVKICGIKTEDALDAAIAAGADYVGFVFFAKSPRNVSVADAARLIRRARSHGRVTCVALLVDPDDRLVDEVTREAQPDILQLHGHESPARVEAIAGRARLPVWKAVAVASLSDVEAADLFVAPGLRADLVLFDAKPPADPGALPGGNGLSFDWRILADRPGGHPFALAGGLTPDTVAEAIRLTRPAIVDVSSGVESAPGLKDKALIRRFLQAAKAANQT